MEIDLRASGGEAGPGPLSKPFGRGLATCAADKISLPSGEAGAWGTTIF